MEENLNRIHSVKGKLICNMILDQLTHCDVCFESKIINDESKRNVCCLEYSHEILLCQLVWLPPPSEHVFQVEKVMIGLGPLWSAHTNHDNFNIWTLRNSQKFRTWQLFEKLIEIFECNIRVFFP